MVTEVNKELYVDSAEDDVGSSENLADLSSANMMLMVMSLFFTANVLMRETSRVGRASGRMAVESELLAAADLSDKAAFKAMLGGILGGCLSIAGGAAGIGFSIKSGRVYNNGAKGDDVNNKAANFNSYGQACREMSSGLGTLTEGVLNGEAQYNLADADRLKARAASLQELVDNWNDVHGQATAASQQALASLKTLIEGLHALELDIAKFQ